MSTKKDIKRQRAAQDMNRNNLCFLILCVLFNFATSCVDNDFKKEPAIDVPDNMVRLNLNTNVGDYAVPSAHTRATADEDEIDDNMWMLIFEGATPESALFTEAVKASVASTGSYVTLTKTVEPCYALVVGNCPEEFYHAAIDDNQLMNPQTLKTAFSNRTLTDSPDILWTTLLARPSVGAVPYIGKCVPMAAIIEIPGGITDGTILANAPGGRLNLKRLVAKADVTSTAADFELSGATVINAPANGCFFGESTELAGTDKLTHYLATDTPDPVSGIASAVWDSQADEYTTRHAPIYLYESSTENNTSLIIKGKYNGEAYYYKLGFHDPSGQAMDILRNKHYKFQITSISGPGKTTLDEAMTAPPINISYHIVVTDDTSHDIISNGKYYLGLSNSELVVCGEGEQQDIIAFTVNTDATTLSGNIQNSITGQGVGLTLINPVSNGAINLSTSPSSPGTTEVRVTLSSLFESGVITVQLGNLVKKVQVTKRLPLSYSGSEKIEGSFVSGVITEKGLGEEWLSLSADGTISSGDEINLSAPGAIYIMAPSNVSASGESNRTGGEFYLCRNTEDGRVKYLVSQACLDVGNIPIDPYGYVGAFWRKGQTGERLIRIPYIDGAEGSWSASVLEGKEWIILDTEESSDPNIGWKSNAKEELVADMNDQNKDTDYQVSGQATSINGNLAKDGHIYFRIGLKSVHLSTPSNPARYGVILLSYNDNRKFSKIYIRQGEDGDYLMRPADTNESGTGWGSPARPKARKFSPYNLTAPAMTAGGDMNHYHPNINLRSGAFTGYPSQAGAYLQWANNNNQRFAYHPVNPMGTISNWQNNHSPGFWGTSLIWSHETCPQGWKRPNDGSPDVSVGHTNNTTESEMRQSLYLNPSNGITINTDNVLYGYYADGFFDRRKVVASPHGTPASAVSVKDYKIAYAGYLFFNPKDNGSIFFPLSGGRSNVGGSLEATGDYCAYWSTTTYNDQSQAWALILENGLVYQSYVGKSRAVSIRCIKE